MLRRIRTAAVALVATAVLVPLAASPASAAPPKKLTILVTNDDGVSAPGIDALVKALRKLPNVKVTVVAPLSNQSGTGDKTTEGGVAEAAETATASGIAAKAVDGFPADSVNWALANGIHPKVVVSGINQGQNLGPVVNASGTVGAAKTAVRNGIPVLAVSQGIADQPDYAAGVKYAIDWVKQHRKNLTGKKPKVELDNLNVPTCLTGKVRGLEEVASGTTGDAVGVSDCTSTATGFTDDVEAFNNGFATLTVVPATDATSTFPSRSERVPGGHRAEGSVTMGALAVSTLSAGWQTFFYALAVGLLVLDGIGFKTPREGMRLGSIGLALFVFVFFWNALAAS